MTAKAPFVLETDIEWAELDLFGHVNNVAFFYYIQKARVRFCEQIGLTALNESNKLGFIVASSHCDFIIPLFYPGKIKVALLVLAINKSSFELSYEILNQQNQTVAKGKDVLVLYDYSKRSKAFIDHSLRQKMLVFQIIA